MGTAWKQQQEANWKSLGKGVDDLSGAEQKNATAMFGGETTGAATKGDFSAWNKQPVIPPVDAPVKPDLTDDLVKKARMSMALRLQATRGRSSTFGNNASMGGGTLSTPALGGY